MGREQHCMFFCSKNLSMKDISGDFGSYKNTVFQKLDFPFERGKKMLDVGCGDGIDAKIFIQEFGLEVYGIDIYENENIRSIKKLRFKKGGIFQIPFGDEEFDYVFLHDVLHHIDEEHQARTAHIRGLNELKRVTKKGGYIIIVEGNRYNPLFYPHMVRMLKHNHWRQSYFIRVIRDVFCNVEFKFFEAHAYPFGDKMWHIYEFLMEKVIPKNFRAYNIAIIRK